MKNPDSCCKDIIYDHIIHLPEQILNASENLKLVNLAKKKDFSKVIISGMGGSAIAGDIVRMIYRDTVDIEVVKDYKPGMINEKTLLISVSYSGNTEEVLTLLNFARDKVGVIVTVTSGGSLLNLSQKHSLTHIILPGGYQPRCGIGFLTVSILKILRFFGLIDDFDSDLKRTASTLMLKAASLSANTPKKFNLARQTAEHLIGSIPVIYSVNPSFTPAAYRWKCQINENSKYPCFYNSFPEMNHNEIESYNFKSDTIKFLPVFLRKFDEEKVYLKRINALKAVFEVEKITYHEFYSEGNSLLEEIFSLIYLGDAVSWYIADSLKIPPADINLIKQLKEKIK